MDISVIVPSYNRASQITNILDALKAQTFKNFEAIIVNDGSKDNTKEVLEQLKNEYPFPIRPIHKENAGRANARNTGAEQAHGKILVFFDDDCRPNPESLASHYEFHTQRTEQPAILDGPALFDPKLVEGDFAEWRVEVEHSWYKNDPEPIEKVDNCSLSGGNISLLKSTWDRIGGMAVGMNDLEDYELGFRAKHQYGIKIFIWWNTWIYHDDFKTFREFLDRRYHAMGSGKKLFLAKPEIIEIYPHRWIFDPTFPKSAIFKFFRTEFMIRFIDKSFLFKLLPQKMRYKLYHVAVLAANIYCKE